LSDPPTAPLGGPPSTSTSTSVVDAVWPTNSTPTEPAIDILKPRWWPLSDPLTSPSKGSAIDVFFNLGGGRYRTHRQRPLGPPPSMYSTSAVDDAVATSSAPQAPHHRHLLQPRWWPLSDLPPAPLRRPAIDVLQQVVVVASIYCQHLLGGHCGKLSLLGMLQARHFMRNFFRSLQC
jgi:hypothetical protein